MNLILYGSLAMVAYSKPWRAMVCNFLDMTLGDQELTGTGGSGEASPFSVVVSNHDLIIYIYIYSYNYICFIYWNVQ